MEKDVIAKQVTPFGRKKTVANSPCNIHGGKPRNVGSHVGKCPDLNEETYGSLKNTLKKKHAKIYF